MLSSTNEHRLVITNLGQLGAHIRYLRIIALMRNTNRCLAFSVTPLSSPNKYVLYARQPKQSWLAVRKKTQ
jgi:hypothetical protein